MRRFFALLAAFALAATAFAQTPEEIVDKMEATMTNLETDGFIMAMDIKIPILGTMSSKAWNRGDKTRIEGSMAGVKIVTWTDGTTEWEYQSDENQVRIRHKEADKESKEESNAKMFTGIREGYDVFLDKETDAAWYIRCKKNRNNKDKDDPKTMDLVVAKDTYYPMSLSAKLKGVTVKMYDLGFHVTEEQVTFDPAAYPGVTIIDER